MGVFAAALVTSLSYSLTDTLGPGPGFFPFWLSAMGIALTGAILLQVSLGRLLADAPGGLLPERRPALQGLGVIVALAAAAVLIEPLGFRLTVLPFVVVLLVVLGARSIVAIALCAAGGSFGVFHVFYYWLKVPLPVGAFGI
jgi:putative tricarboxylic transport membrane protein